MTQKILSAVLEIGDREKIPEATPRKLREFGMAGGIFFIGIFGLLLPWLKDRPLSLWPFLVGGFFWGMALLFPVGLKPIFKVFLWVGSVLGWINTRILLGAVYYLILTPMGLFMRAMGKNTLAMKIESRRNSYRIPRDPHSKINMEAPF